MKSATYQVVLQVRKSGVKLPQSKIINHKITDDNLSIRPGVINESDADCLRSGVELAGKAKQVTQRQN